LSALGHEVAPPPHASRGEVRNQLFSLLFVPSLILMVMTMGAPICRAQEGNPPSVSDKNPGDKNPAAQDQGQKPAGSATRPAGRGRMFGVVPTYGLVEAGEQPPPLSSGQKFKLAVQYLNPYTFVFVAVEAGINQASNSPQEYGRGMEGYGKRFGAGFADGLTDGIFVTGVYPSVLRQDPRYYRLGDGHFSHRAGYAASRILVTRQDSGRKAFNLSEILGGFTSSAIAITYYPASQRDFSDVAERAGVQFGFDAGFNLLKEFYPDIERKLFGRKRKP